MSVRAKFVCQAVSESSITLNAVYSPDPESENGKFFSLTPSGSITLNVVNKHVTDQFAVGQELYVDFTPAK